MAGPIPGTEAQIPTEAAPAPTGMGQDQPESGADQLTQLVGGISEGMSTIRGLIEATPGAPQEAGVLIEQSLDAFMQAMQLMIAGGGEDEMAAESQVPVAPQAALAERPAIRPKGMGTL